MDQFSVNLAKVLAHSVVYYSNPDNIEAYAFGGPEFHSAPSGGETTEQMLRALTQNLPDLMSATNAQILPSEQAQAEASRVVSPIYSEINKDIYDTTGRELNTIANEIARENALAQAATDAAVLAGPGQELVKEARKAAEYFDPEYFGTREVMAKQLNDMLQPGLTGGEREEITRALNRGEYQQGVSEAPSNLKTVSGAMKFGSATRDRMAQALALATNTLPTFRSNVDTFQQATGRPSMVNTGEQRTGTAKTQGIGAQAQAASQGLMSQIGQNFRQSVDINSGQRATGPSTFDKITGVMGAFNPFG